MCADGHCSFTGKINRGGKLYCGKHDPEAVKARREKMTRLDRVKVAFNNARNDLFGARESAADLIEHTNSFPMSEMLDCQKKIRVARVAMERAYQALQEIL